MKKFLSSDETVICMICKKQFKWLSPMHLKKHHITYDEYLNKFNLLRCEIISRSLRLKKQSSMVKKHQEGHFDNEHLNQFKKKKGERIEGGNISKINSRIGKIVWDNKPKDKRLKSLKLLQKFNEIHGCPTKGMKFDRKSKCGFSKNSIEYYFVKQGFI